jgi:OmpA-OmpF porin, OOP family
MKHSRLVVTGIVLIYILSVQGCTWINRMWGKSNGPDEPVAQSETQSRQGEPSATAGTTSEQPALVEAETQAQSSDSATIAPADEQSSNTQGTAEQAAMQDQISAETMQAPPTAPDQPEPVAEMTLSGDAVFAFGKSDEGSITPEGQQQLGDLAAKLVALQEKISSVAVIGHADRLGSPERIQMISKRRAAAVKAYLSRQGLNPTLIVTEAQGASAPLVECPGTKVTPALIQCLAPNRRVEVIAQSRQ